MTHAKKLLKTELRKLKEELKTLDEKPYQREITQRKIKSVESYLNE